ncbi:MAG TPA: hypothetical protein VI306_00535 [Pyrinomonadaceae bacterium]
MRNRNDRQVSSLVQLFRFVGIAVFVFFSATPLLHAQVCATAGKDGPGGTLSGVINTYYPGVASASAGSTSISIGAPTGAATSITTGDLLLVIQMQDAAINSSNSDSYGSGVSGGRANGATNINNSGLYEFVVATSNAGSSVSVRGVGTGNGLRYSYTNANATSTAGQRRFQVVRVPQYSSATLGSSLTAAAWNGTTGGVLVFDVAGNLGLGSASMNVNGLGFRGGIARQLGGDTGGSNTDYVNVSTNAFHGGKAEGIAGTPRYVYDNVFSTDTGVEGYPNGSTGRGAPGNAGGGGTDGNPGSNDQNSGGGGGGNGGAGGLGGNTWSSNLARGGEPGAAVADSATRLVLGGGGGGGSRNNSSGNDGNGGVGGGIVIIRAGTMTGSGTIQANGTAGTESENDGGGGGGAGGSVLVIAEAGGLGSLTIQARGAAGADAWPTQAPNGTPGERHGPGGGGGGGFIAINGSATTSVTGGQNGTTTTADDAYGATAGSTGSVLSITSSQVSGADSTAECKPVITTTKTTTTASVTNSPTGTLATYTIVVANAANLSSALQVNISDPLPTGFTYNSTVTLTPNGGATRTTTVDPTAGSATPNWGTFAIPGGGNVTITFRAAVASTVALGTYQNSASAIYSDPVRTAANGTVTVTYNSASSTGEDVTVVASDLTITKTHTGNFTQAQVGATYVLTVTNSGTAATSGVVTVVENAPTGLTVTAMSGTGWTCVLASFSCTRSNALAAATSYPTITVTVTVANNAPTSLTNSVTVSGGNEANTTNDTATDPTTIAGATPPNISLVKSVSPTGVLIPGTDLTYTITYTNSGGLPATVFAIIDPNPQNTNTVERVLRNVDFKVGSQASAAGSTGLTVTIEFSNDGGVTWTYTPVSAGGGAVAGYDRNVTNLRWRFTGSLSHLTPNNTGSVSFAVRIR